MTIQLKYWHRKSFTTIFIIVLIIVLSACNSKEKNLNSDRQIYQAVHNKDTAILTIAMNKTRFHGQYEIKYYQFGKDSGDVRGDIVGDTLKGNYHFYSNGGSMKRVPLALLKKQNKLFLGTGVIGTYMNLPCYVPEVPIDYSNPDFIFEPVNQPSKQ